MANNETEVLKVITFCYGQRAQEKELEKSKALCEKLGLSQEIIDITWLSNISNSSLTNKDNEVPVGDDVVIDSLEVSKETAKSVWVPNRNGVFLNVAGAYADALNADVVIPGFNLEEAQTFPDNSTEYMKALDHSFSYSTQNKVKVACFTDKLNKTEIVMLARGLNIDFNMIWPCYFSGDTICGQCESCKRYLNAIDKAGLN